MSFPLPLFMLGMGGTDDPHYPLPSYYLAILANASNRRLNFHYDFPPGP